MFSNITSIRDKFKDSGLQVIVEMTSIQLTPEITVHCRGPYDWCTPSLHLDGKLNERVVVTTVYCVDSGNVAPNLVSFSMQTDNMEELWYGNDYKDEYLYNYDEKLWGACLQNAPCLQNYGEVEIRQGRLLVFPSAFQHDMSQFELQNPHRPGQCRIITLYLVDPHQRIISTGKCHPSNSTRGEDKHGGVKSRLPPEILNAVLGLKPGALSKAEDGLMTVDEAKKHRLALLEERRKFRLESEQEWDQNQHDFEFCEHVL
ncbi:hypothetical protein B0H63DRAFT_400978 [Podospora didyma]|uniref:DUF4246 domain-containing protein n=1 Tax=Podospora didyma TaxID=330526 RepID=A0AAE0N8B8_9PEZI|nr:hypothetical protein B0H63DRAFT_400978 [Podospora didyma]